jgi:NADH:ubiquinone oxidoreductase subunit 3 (subunit A)
MFREHILIVVYALFVLLFAVATLALTKLFGSEASGDAEKFLPDATTSDLPIERTPGPFLPTMMFVLLGGAMVLVLLWARLCRIWLAGHLVFAFFSTFIFAGILFAGYIWIYKKSALNW